jgi:hypothetical protein
MVLAAPGSGGGVRARSTHVPDNYSDDESAEDAGQAFTQAVVVPTPPNRSERSRPRPRHRRSGGRLRTGTTCRKEPVTTGSSSAGSPSGSPLRGAVVSSAPQLGWRPPAYGWMTAEPASLRGTRLSIRDPVSVLTNTDSASLTGLVTFPGMAPYMARAASGPLTDQLVGRRVGVLCDAVSLVPVGLAPARTRSGPGAHPSRYSPRYSSRRGSPGHPSSVIGGSSFSAAQEAPR